MINHESIPAKTGNLIAKKIGQEIIIVSEKENLIHTFNGVAAAIWNSIDSKNNLNIIIENVCNEFDVSRENVENDLFPFIIELEKVGLITLI